MRWKATIRGYFFIHTAVTPQIDKTGAQGEYNSAHMHPTTIITPPPPACRVLSHAEVGHGVTFRGKGGVCGLREIFCHVHFVLV